MKKDALLGGASLVPWPAEPICQAEMLAAAFTGGCATGSARKELKPVLLGMLGACQFSTSRVSACSTMRLPNAGISVGSTFTESADLVSASALL